MSVLTHVYSICRCPAFGVLTTCIWFTICLDHNLFCLMLWVQHEHILSCMLVTFLRSIFVKPDLGKLFQQFEIFPWRPSLVRHTSTWCIIHCDFLQGIHLLAEQLLYLQFVLTWDTHSGSSFIYVLSLTDLFQLLYLFVLDYLSPARLHPDTYLIC